LGLLLVGTGEASFTDRTIYTDLFLRGLLGLRKLNDRVSLDQTEVVDGS
jgi:hypothetical protein